MDRKSILVLIVCVALLALWQPLVNKIYPPKPLPPGATNAVATVTGTNGGVGGSNAAQMGTQGTASLPATVSAVTAAPGGQLPVLFAETPDAPEELVEVIVTNQAHYTFTSHGGGIKLVELTQYPETTSKRRALLTTNRVATLNQQSPAPVLAVWDGPAWQGNGLYKLTRTEKGVRAEKELTNGLAIIKTFEIGSNYLITANISLQNRSGQPLSLPAQEWVVGTSTPMNAEDDGTTVGMMWYNGSKTEDVLAPWFQNATMGCFPGTPRWEYRNGQSNVVWASAHNQFFTLAAMPKEPAQEVVTRRFELKPGGPPVPNAKPIYAYISALGYPGLTLEPGKTVERQIHFYAGPKEYQTLARLAARSKNEIDQVMGFGGFFGFFSKGLLLSMNWLHDTLSLSYGWAIIVITLIIKVLFWPLTAASTRSMKRMAALQPQMKAIQEKYKEDPAKMNRKVMEFMKENKVSPLGGCLPMVLQMPVFIGFFYMIRSAIELRGASFLWVGDLSRSDTLFMIPGLGFIPFLGVPGEGLPFNLLPLLMAGTMFYQAQLTPPSPGMDPTQAKLMRYMPVIFAVFLYNFSAGLTLYWTVQNILSIIQTKLTKTQTATPTAPVKAVSVAPRKKK